MQVKSLVLALAGLCAGPSLADIPVFQLDEIVVTASRVPQPANQTGATIIVLKADELRERGLLFVSDALQEIPALMVSGQGTRGSLTQLRVRGNEANHVLVLVDGMRMANASTGELDLANLGLDDVDTIEVLLGPQSTLYGSDAMAGVISITTLKGRTGFSGWAQAGLGSLGTRTAAARLSGGNDGWHYRVAASNLVTDGISSASEANGNSERDGFDKRALSLKAGYDDPRFQAWLDYRRDEARVEFDSDDFMTGMAVDAPDNRQKSRVDGLAWNLSVPLLEGRMDNHLRIANTRNNQDIYSVFFGSGSTYVTETERETVEYQGSYRLSNRHRLQFGAEHYDESLLAEGFGTFERGVSQTGLHVQWLATLGRLDLALGGRRDDHELFGQHDTYRLTANYRIDDRLRVRAAHGTGFKAPSLQELFDTGYGGNPALEPEETRSSEIGLEYRTRRHHAAVTLFDQDTDNLIRYVGVYPTGVNENVDQASSRGVELSLGTVLGPWRLETGLTHVQADETRDGITRDRQRVPEWSGNLLASYFHDHGRAWAQAVYRGDRRDLNFATQQDVRLDSYWLLNVGASYTLSDTLTLTGRIDNLTDESYEEVYSYGTAGRTGMVTLDWRF